MSNLRTEADAAEEAPRYAPPPAAEDAAIIYDSRAEDEVLESCRRELAAKGWCTVRGVDSPSVAERFFGRLGSFVPQYSGELSYEVKALPGYEKFQYSQSANTIQPHTEAPGYLPPPRYLAFYCHHQATCGGGHTLLADGYEFINSLDKELSRLARERLIHFQRTTGPREEFLPGTDQPIFSASDDGTPVLRFSYNVLRYNHLHPTVEIEEGDEDDLNCERGEWETLDPFSREMCQRGLAFFRANQERALAPRGGMLIFDNWRMMHARDAYSDTQRHMTRYWIGAHTPDGGQL